jgi:hypothetical protein
LSNELAREELADFPETGCDEDLGMGAFMADDLTNLEGVEAEALGFFANIEDEKDGSTV